MDEKDTMMEFELHVVLLHTVTNTPLYMIRVRLWGECTLVVRSSNRSCALYPNFEIIFFRSGS